MLSIVLLCIFGEIVGREFKQLRQAIDLAIVSVQFFELNCF